jgi:arsenate reductase (thioredoxin)
MTEVFNVLFLCTGNSARSIIAEALLGRLGGGRFRAFSAGSHPAGRVNPLATAILLKRRFAITELRSKSWDEFAEPGAPPMDMVITVCDQAAGEVCPLWPGQPLTAHWGIPDPAAETGGEAAKRAAFADAFERLRNRVAALVGLPFDTLDADDLKRRLAEIGENRSGRKQ